MIPGHPSPVLSVVESASYLGVSEPCMWRLIKAGEVKTLQIGRRRLVLLSSLDEFVERRAA